MSDTNGYSPDGSHRSDRSANGRRTNGQGINGHTQKGPIQNGHDHVFAELRNALAEMRHDLNNPLAIIAGNVQYLLEVAHASDYDEHVFEPLQDIEEASQQITDSLDELEQFRRNLPRKEASSQSAS